MNNDISNYFFPEFHYPFSHLARFLQADKLFTILLKDGSITHFQPNNVPDFRNWLVQNHVEDLKASFINRLRMIWYLAKKWKPDI